MTGRDWGDQPTGEDSNFPEIDDHDRLLLHATGDQLFSWNPDGTYRFVNNAYARVLGLSPADIIGKTPHDLFPAAVAEDRLALLRHVFASGKPESVEMEFVVPNGETRYAQSTLRPCFDKQGKPLWALGIVHDISDRKRSEALAEESSRRLALVIRSGHLAV